MPEIEEVEYTERSSVMTEAEHSAMVAYYEAHKAAAARYGKEVFEKAGVRGAMVFRVPREDEFYVGVCNDNTPSTSRRSDPPYCVKARSVPPTSYGACQRRRFVFVLSYRHRNETHRLREHLRRW